MTDVAGYSGAIEMNLDDFYNNLSDAIRGDNTIDLSEVYETNPFVEYLQISSPTMTSLIVTSVTLTRSDVDVTLKGTATFLGVENNVTLTGKLDNTNLLVTLQGKPQASWNFKDSFPNLPDGIEAEPFFYELCVTAPKFTLCTTIGDSSSSKSTDEVTFRFSGTVDATQGPLESIDILPDVLKTEGTIQLRTDTFPLIDLAVDIPFTFKVGNICMEKVQLKLQAMDLSSESGMSSIGLEGTITIGEKNPVTVTLTAYLSDIDVWVFSVTVDDEKGLLAEGLEQVAALITGSKDRFELPEQVKEFTDFSLSFLSIGIDASESNHSVKFVTIEVSNPTEWNTPIPHLTVKSIKAGWIFVQGGNSFTLLEAYVCGTVNVEGATLSAHATLFSDGEEEELKITANLVDGETNFGEVLEYYTEITGIPELHVTAFNLTAYPLKSKYSVHVETEENWSIGGPIALTLETVSMDIEYNENSLYGMVKAQVEIAGMPFDVTAEKPESDAGWVFSLSMAEGGSITMGDLVSAVLDNMYIPDFLQCISLTKLSASIETKLNEPTTLKAYSFQTKTEWNLSRAFSDIDKEIEVDISLNARKEDNDKDYIFSGSVRGNLKVYNLDISVCYEFAPNSNNDTITFSTTYKGITITAELKKKDKERILEFKFPDLTLGQVVEYLVNLAAPGKHVKLEKPWDVLNQINFKNISLIVNLTNKEKGVTVDYKKEIDLIFINIKSIGFTYKKRGSVDIRIAGKFLGQEYGEEGKPPLTWDIINDTPPRIPGKGKELLDLRYVGLGQHVALPTDQLDTVSDVITALKDYMKPVTDTEIPLGSDLKFDACSHLLFGLDVTVIDTVVLSAVFDDPYLYGLLVSLSGPRASSFSGLRFEILYKKVTDDIGVYKTELRLPDQFRRLEFGAAALTLPVIKVDVYTNGNFRVDMGFPENGNFADSFCLEIFPFIGFGGFYFADLCGATSSTVPKITNGVFDPVIECGIGISVGVGKTIVKGPLKAGLYIVIEGIIEGSVAWFNPNDKAVAHAQFYRIQGAVGIVGKIYGIVDFKVIKVSVTVEAREVAIFIIESYEPIQVALVLHVKARATIKIFFVKLHFSFGLTLSASFTIGHRGTPPWTVDTSPPQPPLLRMQQGYYRRPPLEALLAKIEPALIAETADTAFDWTPVPVFDTKKLVLMDLLPAFTVSDPSSKKDSGSQKISFMLFVKTSIPPDALGQSILTVSANHLSAASDAGDIPFNVLAKGMLAWSIHALKGTLEGNITITELKNLYDELDDPNTRKEGFSYRNLVNFIRTNYTFRISGIPESVEKASTESRAVFPMIPELSFATQDNKIEINFKDHNKVDQDYEDCLDKYFKQLMVGHEENTAIDPFKEEKIEFIVGEEKESMATVIFRDYFLMVAKSVVQSAIDVLQSFTYTVQKGDSLSSIAEKFPKLTAEYLAHRGESLDMICGEFGMTAQEFQELNPVLRMTEGFSESLKLEPGNPLNVAVSVSAESIAEVNQKVPLKVGTALSISGIRYQVKAGECLNDIATTFNLDVSSIFSDPAANAAKPILQPGAQFTIPQFTYESQEGDTPDFVAAFFYARNGFTVTEEEKVMFLDCLAWYTQTIVNLNRDVNFDELSPGTDELEIPSALHDPTPPRILYTVRDADTLDLIARYYLLMQIQDSILENLKKSFEDFKSQIKVSQKQYTIPEMIHTIQSNDTFQSISTLFPLPIVELVRVNADKKELLAPLSVLEMPQITHTIAQGDTCSSLANTYNMTVGELASTICAEQNIFGAGEKIEITDVPTYKIEDLIKEVVNQGKCNRIASMVSRFLVSGLRVPDPKTALNEWCQTQMVDSLRGNSITLHSLYDMTGQQILMPTTLPYSVTFTKDESAEWIEFALSAVIRKSDTTEALTSQCPRIEELNPGIDFEQLNPGAIVIKDKIDTLTILWDNNMVAENRPSTTFEPKTVVGPKAVPLYRPSPIKYGLQNCIHWQASKSIWNGNISAEIDAQPKAGEPTVWLFSDSLMNKARTEGPQTKFGLFTTTHNAHGEPSPVTLYTWAALVEIKVRRLRASEGALMLPNSYELLGANQDDRQLLLKIWQYLEKYGKTAKLYLLYNPNADSDNPQGLASDVLDEGDTFLLKTNLSTITTSGAKVKRGLKADTGLYSAFINEAGDFIKLLWEGSITGMGGYYLHYKAKNGGRTGLPEQVFAESSVGAIKLVIILDSQIQEKYPCSLGSFNNCAVVGDNIDPSSTTVCAGITSKNDQVNLPTIPPGNVGFEWIRLNPEYEPDTEEKRTRQLYQLLGYKILDTDGTESDAAGDSNTADLQDVGNSSGFYKSYEGLPVGPAEPEIQGSLEKVSVGRADVVWGVNKNVVFYWDCFSFQIDSQAPALKVISVGSDGSVWGIDTDDKIWRKAQGGWQDVPGSLTLISVGSTEQVWGIDGTTVYQWDSSNNKFIEVPLELKDISVGSDGSVWGIGTDDKILRVNNWYFQQAVPVAKFAKQHDLPSCTALPDYLKDPYAGIGKDPITGKLFKVLLELGFGDVFGNRAEESEQLPIPVGYIDKIIGLSQWPGTTSFHLFDAVGLSPKLRVDISLQIPNYMPSSSNYKALYTASTHLERFKQVYYQISQKDVTLAVATSMNQEPDRPPHEYQLTAVEKRALINFTGASWVFLTTILQLKSDHEIKKDETLSQIATSYNVSIPDIGQANKDVRTTDIFSSNIDIPLYYMVRGGDTLNSVVSDLETGITVKVLAENNKDVPMNPAVPITLPITLKIKATTSDSLKSLATVNSCTVDNIAVQNAERNDILKEGAQFKVDNITVQVEKKDVGTDSFNDLVEKFKENLEVTVPDIAATNDAKSRIFNDNITLAVTNYVIQEGDTFETLAEKFGVQVGELAESAKDCPTIFACGTPLYVKPDRTIPPSDQTLSDVALMYGISVEQLISQNKDKPLGEGTLIIPNMVFIDQPDTCYAPYKAKYDTFQGISNKFGMDLNNLTDLNKNLPYIFNGGKMFTANSTQVTTKEDDSMASLCDRYSMTPEQLVRAVKDMGGLIREGALFVCLLPSTGDPSTGATTLRTLEDTYNIDSESIAHANASLQNFLVSGVSITVKNQSLTTNENETFNTLVTRFSREKKIETTPSEIASSNEEVPFITKGQKFILPPAPVALTVDMADHSYPGAIFELKTDFVISRDRDVVNDDFKDTEDVWKRSSPVAPKAEAADNGALSLKTFASSFEKTFPDCKVAVGKTKSTDGVKTRHIWVVNFGKGGISEIDIKDDPVYFGVKPLCNTLRYKTGVSINQFDSATGKLGDSKPVDFQAIDMEIWARQFLNAVELLLSPEYAVQAYQLNENAFETVVKAKKSLAEKISEGLGYILEQNGGNRSSAQETLKQHLMINLAKAYETDAVIQYPVSVVSPFTERNTAARLSGNPVPAGENGEKYSISSAKTSLYNGDSEVNFLFKVKKEAEYKNLSLGMNYVINELEYDIQNVDGVEGYQSSSWLSFILPIGKNGTEISINTFTAEVPIPLRFYPEPPSLILQSGTASNKLPQTVDEAKKWDYAFVYEHKDAAQDTVYLDVIFNKEDSVSLEGDTDQLFDALAQFITVYPQIETELANLLDFDSKDDILTETLNTFSELVLNVANAWNYTKSSYITEGYSLGIQFSYKMQIEVEREVENGYLKKLILFLLSNPVNPPIFDGQFPDIYWISKESGEIKLLKSVESATRCSYSFDEIAVPAYTSQQYKLEFDNLNIVTVQNALGSVYVTRNETLIEGKRTRPYFVYKTPLTSFPNILTPFIRVDNFILFSSGEDFKIALKTLFTSILETQERHEIKVSVQYGYELVSSEGKEPIVSLLPVCFKPKFTYYEGFPDDLYNYIKEWEKGTPIASTGGMYVLEIGVFSSLSGGLLYPLLELKKLGYRISGTL